MPSPGTPTVAMPSTPILHEDDSGQFSFEPPGRLDTIAEEEEEEEEEEDVDDQVSIPELQEQSDEDIALNNFDEPDDSPPAAKRSRLGLFRAWKSKQEEKCVETKDQIASCVKMLNVLKKSKTSRIY